MKTLDFFATQAIETIYHELKSSKEGLSEKQAASRLKEFGLNTISEKKELHIFLEFLSHFLNPLILILLAAATISAFLGQMHNFVIISIMVFASVILDFFEEHRASQAAKKLKERVSNTATVIRKGKKEEIKTSHVCAGDIIYLSTGDLVPADARIIEENNFFVDESALTGEPYPAGKTPHTNAHEEENGHKNLVFLGSNVIKGTALAIVIQTGKATEFGHIAENILGKEEKSEFEKGITHFGYFLMKIILIMVLFIFLGNAIMKQDILESFMFAVAIAVGVTPELLPMILSVTLSTGAKRMSRMGVIVKKLSAIPNLGGMNILCTDKTGTLTESKIKLMGYTDSFGNPEEKVFLFTYLNSEFQTGVKNPLDQAVVEFKKIDTKEYLKTEEIPFDFVRKMMSVIVENPQGRMLITKGAPEAVIEKCTHYEQTGKSLSLDAPTKKQIFSYYEKLSAEGYRVLAVAIKTHMTPKVRHTHKEESDLTLIGFISFFDPAKKDVGKVLQALHNQGIETKILSGDNELVCQKVCQEIGMEIKGVLLGKEIKGWSEPVLAAKAEKTTIFARFSPSEKSRVILALRSLGNVVGYMGDGINDAPSLKDADVGISVNTAADVAKETANIILTKKQLKSVVEGVREGRKAFGNTMKYIMMALSSNFGNMLSVLGAIFYLPFLPMLPIQILLNNFIYDFSQITIPSDKVDETWTSHAHKWNLASVKSFMFLFGPISSLFDFLTFIILFSVFHLNASSFQTGWFMESLATQTLVIHIIRTQGIPFIQSRASKLLTITTLGAVFVGWFIPYTPLGRVFQFSPLPLSIVLVIAGLVLGYLILVELMKRIYFRKHTL